MESRMLDLPDPLRPVIALKCVSKLFGWWGNFEVDRLNKNNGISRNERDDCLVHIGS